jgi:hypothetical protein
MRKRFPATFILFFFMLYAHAQIGAMKLVGPGTKDYSIGVGAFIKGSIPASDAADVTIELGANFFPSEGGWSSGEGTAMCPLKVGYRYTLNGTGEGFYVEPQAGYNVYGVTSLTDDAGKQVDLKYHGVVFAAGTGYLFSIWDLPFDLNLRYETVMAHGGSNNFISLGISRFISFGKRD